MTKEETRDFKKKFKERKDLPGSEMRNLKISSEHVASSRHKADQNISVEVLLTNDEFKSLVDEITKWAPPLEGSHTILGVSVFDPDDPLALARPL